MKTNIATTREQSDRLLQCGVSAESADMCYQFIDECVNNTDKPICSTPKEQFNTLIGYGFGGHRIHITPAWSLSALLGLLPFKLHEGKYEYWRDIAPMDYGKQWSISYYCTEKPRVIKGLAHTDSLVECAVREIEWLYANGYALNGIEKGGEA